MQNNSSLSFQIVGQGPPLLLVHGFGISFNIWANLLPRLSPHFTLVMPELPGIGDSDSPPAGSRYLEAAAQGLLTLRRSLGIERWDVLGYSSGSRAAEAYLNLDPAAARRVVMLCPARVPALSAAGLRFGIWLDRCWPRAGDFFLSDWRLDFFIRLLGFSLRPSPHAAAWKQEIGSRDIEILKETLRSMPAQGAAPFRLPDVPVVYLWGRSDLVTATPRRPGATDRLIPGSHSALVTHAEEVAGVIYSFLLEGEQTCPLDATLVGRDVEAKYSWGVLRD